MGNVTYQRGYVADANGTPLDSGSLFIGEIDKDPEVFPIACFWDAALTIPAPQPIAISTGYVVNGGARAELYIAVEAYSLRIRNRSGVQVDYLPRTITGFIQSGTGAIARTVQSKLREAPISPFDFMDTTTQVKVALSTALTADAPNVQAAINSAVAAAVSAKTYVVNFPSGLYPINADIVATVPIYFQGSGAGKTIIRQTNSTANGLNFDFASLVQGGGVDGISIEAGTGWLSGGNQNSGSTGVGIALRNSNGKFYAKDFGVHNFDTALRVRGCFYTSWTDFEVLYATTAALVIDTSDGTNLGTTGAGNFFGSAKLSNFGFSGTNTGSTGVQMLASGGDFFSFIDATTFNKAWMLAPTTGKQVLYPFFSNCLGDTCLSHNWEVDGTNGNVWSVAMSACWAGFSTGGSGLRVLGSGVDSVKWTGGRIRENGQHGASIEGGVNVSITGAEVASNGKQTAGTYHGINIAANVSSWTVSNCRIGNFASSMSPQQNGISIAAGTSQNFIISYNDLRGNLNLPISLGTSSSNYTIAGNLPQQTFGLNTSNAVAFSASTPSTVAANATVYLGPNGLSNSNSNESVWVMNKTGVLREFYAAVDTTPGASQTYTYTVFKNGSATTMTGSIINGSFIATSTANPVAVSPGDYIGIRLVTSATAALAKHRYYVSVE